MRKPVRKMARCRRPLLARSVRLAVETLDNRIVPSAAKTTLPIVYMSPHGPTDTPWPFPAVDGYTPQQLTHGYGIDQIHFGNVTGNGAGTTIAIVDAFDDPEFVSSTDANFKNSDLAKFDAAFGLPDPPSFEKVSSSGSTTQFPPPDPGWASEIALDVEWAHAVAPQANIVLVEANDDGGDSLAAAVGYARSLPQVNVVSMSFSGAEFVTDIGENSLYTTPSGHIGMAFFGATGDFGAPSGYPAYAPSVIAVGGTQLNLDSSGNVERNRLGRQRRRHQHAAGSTGLPDRGCYPKLDFPHRSGHFSQRVAGDRRRRLRHLQQRLRHALVDGRRHEPVDTLHGG